MRGIGIAQSYLNVLPSADTGGADETDLNESAFARRSLQQTGEQADNPMSICFQSHDIDVREYNECSITKPPFHGIKTAPQDTKRLLCSL